MGGFGCVPRLFVYTSKSLKIQGTQVRCLLPSSCAFQFYHRFYPPRALVIHPCVIKGEKLFMGKSEVAESSRLCHETYLQLVPLRSLVS